MRDHDLELTRRQQRRLGEEEEDGACGRGQEFREGEEASQLRGGGGLGGRIKDTSKSPIIIFKKHRLCPLNYIPYVSKVKKHNYCLVLQCLLTRCSSESEHRHWTG
jgi:hypothetical protein